MGAKERSPSDTTVTPAEEKVAITAVEKAAILAILNRQGERSEVLTNNPDEVLKYTKQLLAAAGMKAEISTTESESDKIQTEPHRESHETDPRMTKLKRQYEDLPEADRTCKGKVRTWTEVVAAIPNIPDFLGGVKALIEPQVYFLNEDEQLVLGYGCAEVPEETLGVNYYQSRLNATRISYFDSEDKVVIVGGDNAEIPYEARVLSERGFVTREEWKRKNKAPNKAQSQLIEKRDNKSFWTESGAAPVVAGYSSLSTPHVFRSNYHPGRGDDNCGSLHVLRVNLNFELASLIRLYYS